MLRFYAIAAVLVVGALAIALLFAHPGLALRMASVQSTGTPSAARRQGPDDFAPPPVSGSAPWALSALPECFKQLRAAHGSEAYVRGFVPANAREVVEDVDVAVADCRLSIYAGAAEVERGDERLFVPPEATFFVTPDGALVLLRRSPQYSELRVYESATGTRLDFKRVFGTPRPIWCFQARKPCKTTRAN